MAFDPSPSAWLGAGYNLTTNTIAMNTANAVTNVTLPQLTNAEADPVTGDIRAVVHAVNEAFFQAWQATAAEDRPQRLKVNRSVTPIQGTNRLRYQYSLDIELDAAVEVAPEPVV